jgi:hypothetical protein
MKLPRRTFLHLAASATALPAARFAWAQAYPRIVLGDFYPTSSTALTLGAGQV